MEGSLAGKRSISAPMMSSFSRLSSQLSLLFLLLIKHNAYCLIKPYSPCSLSKAQKPITVNKDSVMSSSTSLKLFGAIKVVQKRSSSSSTSIPSTFISGGAYQEVPRKVLLEGVLDRPVLLKRPEKLRNKYFGLRHGKKEQSRL